MIWNKPSYNRSAVCVCVCAVCIVIDNEIYNNLIFATTPCSCVCKHGFSSSAFFRILFSSAKLPPSGTWWAGFYLLYHLCDSLHISHIHRLRSSLKFYPEVFVSVYSFTTTINVKLVKWDNAQQTKTLKDQNSNTVTLFVIIIIGQFSGSIIFHAVFVKWFLPTTLSANDSILIHILSNE